MANPYENNGSADPFRERTSPQPPTTANAARAPPSQTGPLGSQPVPNYTDSYDSARKPDFVGTTAVPMDGSPSSAAAATATPQAAQAQPVATEELAPPKPTSKFWTVEFYQQYFDVTTRQVLIRMSNTLVPLNPPDFLLDRNWHYNSSATHDASSGAAAAAAEPQQGDLIVDGVTLSRKPDLYGPFWICTTLWMTLGIVSNIMSKIAATHAGTKNWQYDFSVASVACIVMYLYCFVFGALVWGVMVWKNLPVSCADAVCLYGYSMFIFILTALLCMVPVSAAQWVFCIVGGLWSTAYLLINFWHMWKASLERNWFIGIVALVSVFHFGLTLSFKFYFFHYKY